MTTHNIFVGPLVNYSKVFSPSIKMRVYYSTYHLWAAKRFTKMAGEIEDSHTGRSVFNIEHRALVTSAIISMISFLEAAINETYLDAKDSTGYYENNQNQLRNNLASKWEQVETRKSRWKKKNTPAILDKYQTALNICDKKEFATHSSPYADVRLSIYLRNDLVHYTPETLGGADNHHLENELKGRFSGSKLMKGSKNPFFPDHCLSYGCANWTVLQGEEFANQFFKTMGIIPNYQMVLSKFAIP